jgi:hypothetical protein
VPDLAVPADRRHVAEVAVAERNGWPAAQGWVAWVMWLFIHIAQLIGFRNRASVLVQWAYAYFTFQRGVRLITASDCGDAPGRS